MEPIEMLSVILISSDPIEDVYKRLNDEVEKQFCACETAIMMFQMFGVEAKQKNQYETYGRRRNGCLIIIIGALILKWT
jgi:hypothetical protein